jgi:cytochrome c553
LNYYDNQELNILINKYLEKELSGYRFVNGIITDITNTQEVEMLENALADEDFPNVKAHLQRALELLSDRKNPDYRNSIKESISAVESIAKEIAQNPKAELAQALREIEKKGKLHGAMKTAFMSLYGYTSDANGIRHALMAEPI